MLRAFSLQEGDDATKVGDLEPKEVRLSGRGTGIGEGIAGA